MNCAWPPEVVSATVSRIDCSSFRQGAGVPRAGGEGWWGELARAAWGSLSPATGVGERDGVEDRLQQLAAGDGVRQGGAEVVLGEVGAGFLEALDPGIVLVLELAHLHVVAHLGKQPLVLLDHQAGVALER